QEPSALYNACRNNDIEQVKTLLTNTSLEQLNRIEPNGSTALHAASYWSHGEIVKLLLEQGADRWIKNRYNMTPYEEAELSHIKEIFHKTNYIPPLSTSTVHAYVKLLHAIKNELLPVVDLRQNMKSKIVRHQSNTQNE
ncbi:unnamed protein product, partial [Didymodactylos carnosus]